MLLALLYDILSWFLSIPDFLFLLLNSLPGGPKFFPNGYGNPKVYFDRRNSVLKSLADGSYDFEQKKAELVELEKGDGIVTFAGQFQSPLANHLPKESQTCYFHLIEPTGGDDGNERNKVYIVMFPATGEMGGSTRRAMAKKLAAQHGWSTIILTAPFYGRRKPPSQKLFFIDSVSDILLQSQAIIEEGMLLTNWILKRNQDALVCHTGFSYGAAMAACASAMAVAGGLDGRRIACAPYLGSSSPNVLADGVLESAIDWNALTQNPKESYAITRKKLYDVFDETQLSVLAKPAAQEGKITLTRSISFSNDGFILPTYSKALESQLAQVTSSPAKTRWYPGGHAFGALLRPYLQKKLVEETVQELISARMQ